VTLPEDDRGTERPADAGQGARPAGPVAGQGTPPSPGGEPGPTPPAAEAEAADADRVGARAVSADESWVENAADDPDLQAKLHALLVQRTEYLDLAKRVQADFENYRKRARAEAQAALGKGKAEVVAQVVPVLDDLERAIQTAGLDPEGDSEDSLAHGVLLVFRGLRETLGRNGVEAVDPTGERFDPNLHEALSTVAADGAQSGTVVETVQKGYRLGDQLVRPARVVVAE
jgi:molecular chaperone GrpE